MVINFMSCRNDYYDFGLFQVMFTYSWFQNTFVSFYTFGVQSSLIIFTFAGWFQQNKKRHEPKQKHSGSAQGKWGKMVLLNLFAECKRKPSWYNTLVYAMLHQCQSLVAKTNLSGEA